MLFTNRLVKAVLNAKPVYSSVFIPARTRVYGAAYAEPKVDKNVLDSIQPDDPIHYKNVAPPNGTESPALSYNPILTKFIKIIMIDGKDSVARSVVEEALYMIKIRQMQRWHKADAEKREKIERNPLNIFLMAIDNLKPIVKVTPVTKGGISYQVPVPISDNERQFRAMKFLEASCLEKEKGVKFSTRLADELLGAYENRGMAYNKKVELHKQAEANRAYAHYRWAE